LGFGSFLFRFLKDENKVEHDASVKIGLYSYEAEAVFNDDGDCYEYPENLDEDSQWVVSFHSSIRIQSRAFIIALYSIAF